MSKELKKRLHQYKSEIDKIFPYKDSGEKAYELMLFMVEKEDLECFNYFSRMLKKTARKFDNQEWIEMADELIKRSCKIIQYDDQNKKEM